MGLVFQSRSFIHLRASDELARTEEVEAWGVEGQTRISQSIWDVTGRRHTFRHRCVEAKWSSFHAPEHALKSLGLLTHSFGFFSLTGDPFDCPDRDRAYVLDRERFREVNTSNCQMLWMAACSGSVGLLHPIDKPHPGNHLR
jgi:hypothetical protein